MKKFFTLFIVLVMCLCFAGGVFAQDAEVPEEAGEPNVSVNAGLESLVVKAGASEIGAKIRFIPTKVYVYSSSVTVEGYFVNLNSGYYVSNFSQFTMDLYTGGTLLISGDFGTINSFEVRPLSVQYQSFTFNGRHRLNTGTYVCDDSFYTMTGFRFSYR